MSKLRVGFCAPGRSPRPPRRLPSPPRWAGTRKTTSRSSWWRWLARPTASRRSHQGGPVRASERGAARGRSRRRESRAKIFYTAYQGNIYGIAVPADSLDSRRSPTSRARISASPRWRSAGVIGRARSRATAGMNPDKDIADRGGGRGRADRGDAPRANRWTRSSQFDTQYAMVENAGVKLRLLDTKDIDRYPSNGFLALEETLGARKKDAVATRAGLCQRDHLRDQQSGGRGAHPVRDFPADQNRPARTRRRRSGTT